MVVNDTDEPTTHSQTAQRHSHDLVIKRLTGRPIIRSGPSE